MTITRTNTAAVLNTTNNQNNYQSAAASPAANALLSMWVGLSDTVAPDDPAVTNSPWALSWTKQFTLLHTDGIKRLTLFTATTVAAPGSDTFDILFTNNATGCLMRMTQWTDSSGSAPTLVQAVTDSDAAASDVLINTLPALGAASWVMAVAICNDTTPVATALESWVEAFEEGFATPALGWAGYHSNGITSDNTPSWDWTTNIAWTGGAIEVAEPVAAVARVPRPIIVPGEAVHRASRW